MKAESLEGADRMELKGEFLMMKRIDLNCDLGESFGAYTIGMDEAVAPHVTSVNAACGWHGGDPMVMERTTALAKRHGAALGAHPGFPDLLGFGRREIKVSPDEVYAYVKYQIGALYAFARAQGLELQHMKAHGALYNMAGKDIRLAQALCRACRDFDSQLMILALAGSKMEEAAAEMGVPFAREFFADRAYAADGSLAPRSLPGAVIHDTDQALARVMQMIKEGTADTIDGGKLSVRCDSVCVHGDNESAVDFVVSIRKKLAEEGVECLSFGAFAR